MTSRTARASGAPGQDGAAQVAAGEADAGPAVIAPAVPDMTLEPVSAEMMADPHQDPARPGIREQPVVRVQPVPRALGDDDAPAFPARARVLASGDTVTARALDQSLSTADVPALGRVLHDGVLYEIGAPVPVNRPQFEQLKDARAAEGFWVDI
ncbi:hypothetical protein [Methylopila sp. M107]|uniref:hypothetical protein n=1 Tax=Methylopila sp. M107 TaxID=1101190 RepID=UPI0003A8033D|nr:hypothetical protein [Methylopila sp. M107]